MQYKWLRSGLRSWTAHFGPLSSDALPDMTRTDNFSDGVQSLNQLCLRENHLSQVVCMDWLEYSESIGENFRITRYKQKRLNGQRNEVDYFWTDAAHYACLSYCYVSSPHYVWHIRQSSCRVLHTAGLTCTYLPTFCSLQQAETLSPHMGKDPVTLLFKWQTGTCTNTPSVPH